MGKRLDRWMVLLLTVAAVLLLLNLGNGRLWQDEAETAVLGKNILRYGYPRAFDDVNRLNPELPVGKGYAWTYHPWLTMYSAAVSFLLLGPTTTAARLPFALMGWISIWLAYRLAGRLSGDRTVARWTAFLLVTSIPFLLHMRQCRYYAPSVLFSLWSVWAYERFLKTRPWAGPELVTALVLLFHFNHGVFLPTGAALLLHFSSTRPTSEQLGKALRVVGTVLLLTAPFYLLLQASQHRGPFDWKEIRHHAEFYFRQINHFILPVSFWLITLLLWRPSAETLLGKPGGPLRKAVNLALTLLLLGLAFLIFVPRQRHFRYLVYLIPWFLFLQAVLLAGLWRRRRWAAIGLAAFLTLTDLHYTAPDLILQRLGHKPSSRPGFRSLPWEFLYELTHTYRGPMDGIVEYLQAHAEKGQTIKIPYEDHCLIFYTPLRVEPITEFAQPTTPDWIVLRRDWLPGGFLQSPYYQEIRMRYRQIVLDTPDIPWQNRPDPGYHRFRTDPQAPPVILFQKMSSSQS